METGKIFSTNQSDWVVSSTQTLALIKTEEEGKRATLGKERENVAEKRKEHLSTFGKAEGKPTVVDVRQSKAHKGEEGTKGVWNDARRIIDEIDKKRKGREK